MPDGSETADQEIGNGTWTLAPSAGLSGTGADGTNAVDPAALRAQ
jgi:hypothetical protein